MAKSARVLIVDDDPPMVDLLRTGLATRGFSTATRGTAEAALSALAAEDFDVLLTDLQLPSMDGIELCRRVAAVRPRVRVVVITAFGDLDAAVAAIRAGASDFLTKPLALDEVRSAVERAVQRPREAARPLATRAAEPPDELLGDSGPMRALRDMIRRVEASDATVLVSGESGTGKELVARTLHRRGLRRDGPFVAVNCAALPEALLESELFGHSRGAFTDAKAAHAGLFAQARGGTLFLDEIGEMPLSIQPKLLRALQERAVRPLGGGAEVPFDARVIAATNQTIEAAVAERRFRQDLYFRLNVIRVEVPPLRVRRGDVALLARHFVSEIAARAGKRVRGLSRAALECLGRHGWPGNVRELENCVERAVAMAQNDEIAVGDLPECVRGGDPRSVAEASNEGDLPTLAEVEQRHIARVLDATGGQKTRAARILGVDRKTLNRKLARLRTT